jgi:transposase
VISGIIHVLKLGGLRIDPPDVYGPRKTLYNHFVRWSEKGESTGIFKILSYRAEPPLALVYYLSQNRTGAE